MQKTTTIFGGISVNHRFYSMPVLMENIFYNMSKAMMLFLQENCMTKPFGLMEEQTVICGGQGYTRTESRANGQVNCLLVYNWNILLYTDNTQG